MLLHGRQHGLGARHVVAVVLQGVGDALAHQGVGGEIDDAVDVVLAEHGVQEGGVPQVAHIELPGALHRLPVAGAQVVHHHHVIAFFHQQRHHVAADVAGAAGNKNRFHIWFLLLCSGALPPQRGAGRSVCRMTGGVLYFTDAMNVSKAARPSGVHL